jgi:hypothetical protein
MKVTQAQLDIFVKLKKAPKNQVFVEIDDSKTSFSSAKFESPSAKRVPIERLSELVVNESSMK